MTTAIPFSEQLSEQWLLERTYHAQLRNGEELSVLDLTKAMEQLIDFPVLPSSQSATSKMPELIPAKKSYNFSVPISTWREVSLAEAQAIYKQGIPLLLYGEHAWERSKRDSITWGLNKNMSKIIYGDAWEKQEALSGIEYAVCYLDLQRGTFSNPAWREWFSSDIATIFDGSTPFIFLCPSVQFPYTTHYTVIAADGQMYKYADRASAIQGFSTLPLREVRNESGFQTVFPQFYYYHEVVCPSGSYRIVFFGSQTEL